MSSLLTLLSQQTPSLQTRKGLIVTGLQNDFLAYDGKLPVRNRDYIDRLSVLVPEFRKYGDVIWVRSEYEDDRPVDDLNALGDTIIVGEAPVPVLETKVPAIEDGEWQQGHGPTKRRKRASDADQSLLNAADLEWAPRGEYSAGADDEELFLTRTSTREPCCLKGSRGAEYYERVKHMQDAKDMHVVKTHYSAFGGTSLLLTLRCKLITELFVCGNMTNLSVYSTAMDAARYGIKVTLIDDCLGYRIFDRHVAAITQLREIMGAETMTKDEVIKCLMDPPDDDEYDNDYDDEVEISTTTDVSETHPGDILEVDDEEISDHDAPVPIVRLSRMFDERLDFRRTKDSGTRPLPIAASSLSDRPPAECPHTQSLPSGSCAGENQRRDRGWKRSARSSFDDTETEHTTAAAKGSLGSGESSQRSGQAGSEPWLNIIPSSPEDAAKTRATPRSSHPGLTALSTLFNLDQSTLDEYEKMMLESQAEQDAALAAGIRGTPLFGEDKEVESAKSRILYDLVPYDLSRTIFEQLDSEITWQKMHHQTGEVPRLVCCQGAVGVDGSMPVYRHPSDQTMPSQAWTTNVDIIRRAAEEAIGHPLNHALIQLYRGGTDYISEHSDKTLDIAPASFIVNVSMGAQRTMRLRTKRSAVPNGSTLGSRTTYRVPMPHNSMISMSLETNAEYLHGINADKRPTVELLESEKAFGGQRISLTFRHIGTFLSGDSKLIWGQGAVGKTKQEARPVVNGDFAESSKLLQAFGAENQASTIEWKAIYGQGSDVLNLK